MNNEQYIEHEVKIRVHDEKFKIIESKLNWLLTMGFGGLILPVILHYLKLI